MNNSVQKLHKSHESKNNKSKSFRRLVFDELLQIFLYLKIEKK